MKKKYKDEIIKAIDKAEKGSVIVWAEDLGSITTHKTIQDAMYQQYLNRREREKK